MLAHREIENYFADLSAQVASLTEYRQATTPYQVTLAPEMAAALGTPQRRLTPFLATVVDVIASKLEVNDDALKLAKVSDTKVVRQWLGDNDWSLVERDLYRAVVRDEKAFVLTAWTSTGPTFRVLTAYNGLSGAHIATDEGVPVYGWNTWTIAGVGYCDVYYPNRIEKYIKPAGEKKEWVPRQDGA